MSGAIVGNTKVALVRFEHGYTHLDAYHGLEDLICSIVRDTGLGGFGGTPEHRKRLMNVRSAVERAIDACDRAIREEDEEIEECLCGSQLGPDYCPVHAA